MADGSLTGCTVLVPAARFDLPAGTPPVPLEVGEFVPGGRRHEAYYKTTSLALKEYLREGKTEYAHTLDWSAEESRTCCSSSGLGRGDVHPRPRYTTLARLVARRVARRPATMS